MNNSNTEYKNRYEFDKNKPNEWVDKEIQKAAARASLEMAKAFMQKFDLQVAKFPLESIMDITPEGIKFKIEGDEIVFERTIK